MIEAKNITKNFRQVSALKRLNVSFGWNRIYGLLGRNGAGKSTLMNILGCMDTLDSGSYFLDSEAVHEQGDGELTRLRNEKIGFIFHLVPQYTALQNVIMPLLLRGLSPGSNRTGGG